MTENTVNGYTDETALSGATLVSGPATVWLGKTPPIKAHLSYVVDTTMLVSTRDDERVWVKRVPPKVGEGLTAVQVEEQEYRAAIDPLQVALISERRENKELAKRVDNKVRAEIEYKARLRLLAEDKRALETERNSLKDLCDGYGARIRAIRKAEEDY